MQAVIDRPRLAHGASACLPAVLRQADLECRLGREAGFPVERPELFREQAPVVQQPGEHLPRYLDLHPFLGGIPSWVPIEARGYWPFGGTHSMHAVSRCGIGYRPGVRLLVIGVRSTELVADLQQSLAALKDRSSLHTTQQQLFQARYRAANHAAGQSGFAGLDQRGAQQQRRLRKPGDIIPGLSGVVEEK